MKHDQIQVFFISHNALLREEFSLLFFDEIDFRFRVLSNLAEEIDLSKIGQNIIFIIDLTNHLHESSSFLEQISASLLSFPTIFFSDKDLSIKEFKKRGFDCFELIIKPINVNQLIYNIRLLIDKKRLSSNGIISIRGNFFTPKRNIFQNLQGKSIKLTEKETKIINFLYGGFGEVRTKDQLLETIWGYNESISTHTLETHIYRLRKKLEIGLNETNLILKSPNGYFLNLFL